MIITSSLLLLVVLGAVESYQFNIQGTNSPFAYNKAFLGQPQQPIAQYQPQFFAGQDSNLQLNSNAQRYSYQPPQNQNQPRFSLPFQQPFAPLQQQQQHQQQLQRQAPVLNKNPTLQLQQNYVPSAPPAQQARFLPTAQNSPLKTVPPPVSSDKDFLSSLQIIDTHGRLRDLKDFGLGGDGNQPFEPELEKNLKLIFDTINKDLQNAAFLPLEVNGARQSHLESSQRSQFPQGTQHSRFNLKQQQLRPNEAREQPQQPLGYSFTQPKQHQFQYLKPVRANQQNLRQQQVQPSPAQAIQGTKQPERHQDEQVPIEQEKIDQHPIKEQAETKQQVEHNEEKSQQAPLHSNNQDYREPETRNRPQQYPVQQTQIKQEPIGQFQAPIEQQPVQTPIQIEQRPVQAPLPIEQQQQQQGFDDEPTPLKEVQYDSKSQVKAGSYGGRDEQSFKQTRVEQAPISRVVEQEPINRAPIEQQKRFEDEQRPQQQYDDGRQGFQVGQPVRSNVKKFEGWVPIVQKQTDNFEQQKLGQQTDYEQRNEEPEQRPISQEKVQQIDQSNENLEVSQEASRDLQENPVKQALAEPVFSQQLQAPTKQVKSRNLVNKFTSSSKTKNSNSITRSQVRKQQSAFQESEQQQRDEAPVQQQRQQEELPAPNFEQQRQELDDGRKQEYSQDVQREDSGPVFNAPITTTTTRPIIRAEQAKGRRVKLLTDKTVRTPIQMVRDQQLKTIRQQNQLATSKEETKRPKQVQAANAPTKFKQEDQQIIKEDTRAQQTPSVVPIFSKANVKILSRATEKQKNVEKSPQQLQYDLTSSNQRQQTNQQPGMRQIQAQSEVFQQKEDLNEQKLDLPQRQEETPSQQREEVLNQEQQQPEERPQVQTLFVQQKEEAVQQREETVQQKEEALQQKEEVVQQKGDAPVQREEFQLPREQLPQQKEEVPQQREEIPQQKEEILQQKEEIPQQKEDLPQLKEEAPQQREELPAQKEEVPQQREELPAQKEEVSQSKEDLSQQRESLPQQQRQEDEPQQVQQKEKSFETNTQRQETFDNTQQVNQGDTSSQLQSQQIAQQESDDNSSANQKQQDRDQQQQQLVREDEKRQEDAQIPQQKQTTDDQQLSQPLNQEKQQAVELPQFQEAKTLIEDEPVVTTTQRPPIRVIRPIVAKKEETRVAKDNVGDVRQEITTETKQESSAPRNKTKPNRQSFKSGSQRQGYQSDDQSNPRSQARSRLSSRQRQQAASGESVNSNPIQQSERQNNGGYLSATQLLDTYNPLQFEPERISSLNRAPSSSSQNSNVNSSPSGESY